MTSTNDTNDTNGHAPAPLAHLSPSHLAILRDSGLTDPTILKSGVQTVKEAHIIGRYLNWNGAASKLGECLGFPYRLPDGGRTDFVRFRPDQPRTLNGRQVKYESPKGAPLRIYFAFTATPEALADPSVPLCVVEGEKKTLRVAQEGFVAVGVAGVWAWQLAREEGDDGKKRGERKAAARLRPDPVGRPPDVPYLRFGLRYEPEAGLGVYHLGQLLHARGADVRVVVLPPGPPGEDRKPAKVGADDYLRTHTDDDLRALMAEAKPPVKPEPDTPIESHDDPHRLARLFVEQNRWHDLDTIRYWREEYHRWDGAAYRALPVKEARAELTACVKAEFDRLNIEAQKQQQKQKEEGRKGETRGRERRSREPRTAEPVTTALIANVAQALTASASCPRSWSLRPGSRRKGSGTPPTCWPAGTVCAPAVARGRKSTGSPTPLFFSRNALDYDFDFDAPAPTAWLDFQAIWPKDKASIDALQEWFGYCLLPDTRQQKILMIVGPKRCGKGTVGRVLGRVIGEANVCGPTFSSLAGSFGLRPLLGKTLAIISDARLTRRTDLALITGACSPFPARTARRLSAKTSRRSLQVAREIHRLDERTTAAHRPERRPRQPHDPAAVDP